MIIMLLSPAFAFNWSVKSPAIGTGLAAGDFRASTFYFRPVTCASPPHFADGFHLCSEEPWLCWMSNVPACAWYLE